MHNRKGLWVFILMMPLLALTYAGATDHLPLETRVSNLETRVAVLEGTPLPTATMTIMPPTPTQEVWTPPAVFIPRFTIFVHPRPEINSPRIGRVYAGQRIDLQTGIPTEPDKYGYRWVQMFGAARWFAIGRYDNSWGTIEWK